MNSKERVKAVLQGQIPDHPPWQEIGFHTEIVSALSGTKLERSNSGYHPHYGSGLKEYEKELDAFIKISEEIGLDAIWLKHWNGANFSGEKGSAYDAGTIKSMEDWKEAVTSAPDLQEHSWYECVEPFVKRVRKTDLAMGFEASFGFNGVLSAIGFHDFCLAVYEKPELIKTVFQWYVQRSIRIIKDFIEYEPDLILLGDDIAFGQGPFISPQKMEELFFPGMKKIAEACPFPWIYHSDGNLLPVMDGLLELGMKGIHPIEPYGTMAIEKVKKQYGDRIILAGNLDMNLIARGQVADIEQEVKGLFKKVGYNGGWMLSSSNSIDNGANVENVKAMGRTIKECTY